VAGGTALTTGYFSNDMVSSLTQGTQSINFSLDPTRRLRQATSATSGSESRRIVNHYSDARDSPTWIATSLNAGSTWTWQRSVIGIDGGLAAIQDSTGAVQIQLKNLHGDVVATVDDDVLAISTNSYFEQTEYGAPRVQNTVNPQRYGWVGTSRRSSDALAGMVLMGVRLFNPASGRFLSRDPILDGNENAYNYPNDPVNASDLDGRCWLWCLINKAIWITRNKKATLSVYPSWTLRVSSGSFVTGYQGWSELVRKYPRSNTPGMREQFVCHVVLGAGLYKSTYNLDPWRPAMSLGAIMYYEGYSQLIL
jgi:RHS repeat-associated protein